MRDIAPMPELILYTTEDGQTSIKLRAEDGTVWLSQQEMAELFATSIPNINQHVRKILADGEQTEATIKSCLIVQSATDPGRWLSGTLGTRHAIPSVGDAAFE